MAWIAKNDLSTEAMGFIREKLTIHPRKVGSHPGPSPLPVVCFQETKTHVGLPRAYFLSNRKPSHDVVWRVTEGAQYLWPGPLQFTGTLRPEQGPAKEKMLEVLRAAPAAGGILQAPCGWGKTVWALSMVAELQVPTLVIVHKDFLMRQWMDRAAEYLPGAKLGVVQGPRCEFAGKHLVVGMVNSLANKSYAADLRVWPGLVIVDEVHRMGAPTFSQAFPRFSARWRLGISATPRRLDGADDVFRYHIGKVEVVAKTMQLAPLVRVVQTKTHLTPEDRETVRRSKAKMMDILSSIRARNTVILDRLTRAVLAGRKCLVVSTLLDHLRMMAARFESEWSADDGPLPTWAFYIGDSTEAERTHAEGCQVIFATQQLVSEGLDIPALDTLFLTLPLTNITQVVGRILRAHEGKKDPIVVDFRDDHVPACRKMNHSRDRVYGALCGAA